MTCKNLIITGSPGVGKTTLIKECVQPFREHVDGFYTEELRSGSERHGFLLKTFAGGSGVMAQKGLKSSIKLNKYGIDLRVIDELGVPAIRQALAAKRIVVVDEIGTMEMMSTAFCEIIGQALSGDRPLLASIRLKAEPFTSQIRKMANTRLIHLTRENFPNVKVDVRRWIEEQVHAQG